MTKPSEACVGQKLHPVVMGIGEAVIAEDGGHEGIGQVIKRAKPGAHQGEIPEKAQGPPEGQVTGRIVQGDDAGENFLPPQPQGIKGHASQKNSQEIEGPAHRVLTEPEEHHEGQADSQPKDGSPGGGKEKSHQENEQGQKKERPAHEGFQVFRPGPDPPPAPAPVSGLREVVRVPPGQEQAKAEEDGHAQVAGGMVGIDKGTAETPQIVRVFPAPDEVAAKMQQPIQGLEQGHPQDKQHQGLKLPPGVDHEDQEEKKHHRRPDQEDFLDGGVAVQGKGHQGAQTMAVSQGPDLDGPGREPAYHRRGKPNQLEQRQEDCGQHQTPKGRVGEGEGGVSAQEGRQGHHA